MNKLLILILLMGLSLFAGFEYQGWINRKAAARRAERARWVASECREPVRPNPRGGQGIILPRVTHCAW